MANAAAKKLAAANDRAIRWLNILMPVVNLNYLLLRYFLHARPFPLSQLFLYLSTLAPTLFIYRYLVQSGTPQRSPAGELLTPGEDLAAGGLMEWAWDVLFVTWGCALASAVVGGWGWWFYLLIPGYALYKGGSFLLPLLRQFTNNPLAGPGGPAAGAPYPAGAGRGGAGAGGYGAVPGAEGLENGAPESKRQQKLRKRMEKGDPRIKQVERKRAA